jgi:recombination protein RecA
MSTESFVAALNKKLGGPVAISAAELAIPRRYTSGSVSLDSILGGGFPGNQWTEFIGPASSGKTATLLKTIAANQMADPVFNTLWVAGEHFDSEQAEALGVDLDRVTVVRTQLMEHAFEAMIDGTSSQEFDFITLDSYPALAAQDEVDKGMDEATMASGARMMNKFIRKAGMASQRLADNSDRPFFGVIINQWRDQIGGFSPVGVPQTTPGGKGKDYFFYTRLDIKRGEWKTEKRPGIKDPYKVGQTIRYRTIKNKSSAPQQTAEVDFYFRGAPSLGFKRGDYDVAKDYVDIALSLGVVERAGAWYRFDGQQWQGKDGLTEAIRSDTLLQEGLRKAVIDMASDPKALERMED